jgi:ABC-type methionine transport system permease subunit
MIDVLLVLKNMQARMKRVAAKRALMTVQQTSVDHLLLSSTGNSEGLDTSVLNMWCNYKIKISKPFIILFIYALPFSACLQGLFCEG